MKQRKATDHLKAGFPSANDKNTVIDDLFINRICFYSV